MGSRRLINWFNRRYNVDGLNDAMKTAMAISFLTNVALIGCLIVFAAGGSKPFSQSALSTVVKTASEMTEAVSPAQTSLDVEPEPFRWSQIESADYRTYIKNLRSIGCPEPTVQAIVAADVHDHYNLKYQELEQKLTALNAAPLSTRLASYKEQKMLETELQKLPGEEASMTADLQSQESQPYATQIAARTDEGIQSKKPPVLPLVFQNVDLSKLNLSSGQLQEITSLRQQFVDEIGGPNQNPKDPAYLQRWQYTQPQIDEILHGMLGVEAFMNYQIMASNQ